MATRKQVDYIKVLLENKGFNTETVDERIGNEFTVRGLIGQPLSAWMAALNVPSASQVISKLRGMPDTSGGTYRRPGTVPRNDQFAETCIALKELGGESVSVSTPRIYRRLNATTSRECDEVRGRLNQLVGMEVATRLGRKRYRWRLVDNWEDVLKARADDGPSEADMESLRAENVNLRNDLEAKSKALDETKEKLAEAEKAGPKVIEIKLRRADGKRKTCKETTHVAFAKVCQLVNARKNVLFVGPAGCGKSFMAKQVQKFLGLPKFGEVNCTVGMSEGHMTGRLLPVGEGGTFEYVGAEYQDCYENGGLILVDEIDAADPNVILALNTSLANGTLPLPNRPDKPYAKRHKDFACIAAANTYGKGADRQYVGRNELDEATLDRFRVGVVEVDYDEELEKHVCPNEELRARFQTYRTKIREHRLERIISTRFLIDAFDMMEQAGWSIADVEEQFFAGWSDDECREVGYAKSEEGGV